MLRTFAALLVVIGCVEGRCPAVASPPSGQIHRVGNRALQLGIDARDGACREFVDVRTGFNHLSAEEKPLALWQITVRDGDTVRTFAADEGGPPRVESLPGGLRLVWDRVGPASSKPFGVEATIRLDGDDASLSRWEISVEKPAGVRLESIQFPRLTALAPRENEHLAVPVSMGLVAANPRKLIGGPDGRGRRLDWLYPGLSLQCLAYYEDAGPGFYAACDDPLAHVKRLAVWGDANERMHFEIVHLPEQEAAGRERYQLPYAVVLGTFQGDWTTAAELYRASASARAFAEQGRLHRGLVPAWVRQTGLWVWNRGRSPGVSAAGLPNAEASRRAGERLLALVAPLRLRRRISRVLPAARGNGGVWGRHRGRASRRRPRHRVHEPAALGNEHRQLDRRGGRRVCRQEGRRRDSGGSLQHVHQGPMRADVPGHDVLARQVRRDGRDRALRA